MLRSASNDYALEEEDECLTCPYFNDGSNRKNCKGCELFIDPEGFKEEE
jgi:hypothetical protein